MGFQNKKVWVFPALILLGFLFSAGGKENVKKPVLIKKYENDYKQTLLIEDFGERLFQARMIATHWSKNDVISAFDWANQPSIPVDSSARFEMLVATVSEMTRKNPMEAWDKVKDINDQEEKESLHGLVIQTWAGENYAAAEQWVAQQQDERFRNSLTVRLVEGNKQQDWQKKLAQLSKMQSRDFAPVLNILNQNASDEFIAHWVLSLPLGENNRPPLLGHLHERLSIWAEQNPEEAISLLLKQEYDKETDFIWVAACRGKLQEDPMVAVKAIQAYPVEIRNAVIRGNLGILVKQDPQMILHWATREQGNDKTSLDILVELQKIAKKCQRKSGNSRRNTSSDQRNPGQD